MKLKEYMDKHHIQRWMLREDLIAVPQKGRKTGDGHTICLEITQSCGDVYSLKITNQEWGTCNRQLIANLGRRMTAWAEDMEKELTLT